MSTEAAPPVAPEVVRLDSVRAGYGRRVVLDEMTLQVGHGVTTVVGPNGGGKSTLLKVMATLVEPVSGTVCVLGNDVRRGPDRRRARGSIGYLEQRARFPPELSVATCLGYAAWLFKIAPDRRRHAVAAALDDFDLRSVVGSPLGTLSGGTYQRVMLAASAIHRPRLLVLDEPTAGVDPEHRATIQSMLGALAHDRAIVISTHYIDDMFAFDARLLVVDHGRIRFDGNLDDLGAAGIGAPSIESVLGRLSRATSDDRPHA